MLLRISVSLAVVVLLFAIFVAPPVSKPSAIGSGLNSSLPVFAILGQTGVGKSTLTETLGGRNLNTAHGPKFCADLESCKSRLPNAASILSDFTLGTEDVAFYQTDLYFRAVYFIDTPGFDDSKGLDDDKILDIILEELQRLYRGDKLIKGVIYLYDISATRIGGMTKKVSIHKSPQYLRVSPY